MNPRAAFGRTFPVKQVLGRIALEAGAVPVIAWAWWRGQPRWARGAVVTGVGLAALPWLFRGVWWGWEQYARYFDWAAGLARGTALETLTPIMR